MDMNGLFSLWVGCGRGGGGEGWREREREKERTCSGISSRLGFGEMQDVCFGLLERLCFFLDKESFDVCGPCEKAAFLPCDLQMGQNPSFSYSRFSISVCSNIQRKSPSLSPPVWVPRRSPSFSYSRF